MLDQRDLATHVGEEGGKAVKVAESRFTGEEGKEIDLAGQQCWLQFVAFDVRLPMLHLAADSAFLSTYVVCVLRCCT
jgi:hypothetical protein